jgi:O-acetyl-ADP-ribose deacetylase (regulator of RNase III)
MPPNIHFISKDKEWLHEMMDLFRIDTNVLITFGDIRALPRFHTTFVSPANSVGFMDGGIDWVLSRDMFPGVESAVRARIEKYGLSTPLGRYYLPVGSAIIVPVNRDHTYVISAPTMFLPRDVSHTQNAYWSFVAALTLHKKWSEHIRFQTTLVVTSHCCGFGKMPAKESARQMYEAYKAFLENRILPEPSDFDMVVYPSCEKEPVDQHDIKEITVRPQ